MSATQKDQELINRIMKLLALAEDQAGNPEGSTAQAMADRLMSKYSIDEKDLVKSRFTVARKWAHYNSMPYWYKDICWEVGRFLGVYTLVNSTTRGVKSIVVLAGMPEDIEIAWYMIECLYNEINRLSYDHWYKNPQHRKDRAWKNDYRVGMAKRVCQRMRDLTKQVVTHKVTDNALVPADTYDMIEAWYKDELGNKVNDASDKTERDNQAMVAGYKDGDKVQLRPGIATTAQTKAERLLN